MARAKPTFRGYSKSNLETLGGNLYEEDGAL